MGIGNIGWSEFLVILAIALIFFGPRRLPGIAQAIGKSLREFQKALNEVKTEIVQAGEDMDTESEARHISPRPAEITPGPTPASSASKDTEPEATREAEVTPLTPRSPDGPATPTVEGGDAESATAEDAADSEPAAGDAEARDEASNADGDRRDTHIPKV
jgi:Tat protein translocase TatB subunit